MNAYTEWFPSHTSFITLRNQGEIRHSNHLHSKEGFFNSISREEKKKQRPGPCVAMVTFSLLLFVLGSRCNKIVGRELGVSEEEGTTHR